MATCSSPVNAQLPPGQHTVSVPLNHKDSATQKRYAFKHWQDGDTSPSKSINVQSNLTLVGTYQEVNEVNTVTFTGKVSSGGVGVALPGKIQVTKPDSSVVEFPFNSGTDGALSVAQSFGGAGSYSAKAVVPESANYLSGSSPVVAFTVGKSPVTVELNVVVA